MDLNPLSWIAEIGKTTVTPITNLIDELDFSGEEEGNIKIKLQEIKNKVKEMDLAYQAKLLDYDGKLLEAKSNIIVAEAQGKSWLQRNWRPLMMLLFGFVILYAVISPAFGLPPVDMSGVPDRLWTLMTVGIGGYIGGRSYEKAKGKS